MLYDYLNILIIAPLLTCLIETPIIRAFKITKNTKYIIAVNLLTNYTLNLIGIFINTGSKSAYIVWVAICEAIAIPLTEAWLYSKISDSEKKKIVFASYVANASSYLLGVILSLILRR